MKQRKLLERVVMDPLVMTGKPVIKWTRLTVQFILDLKAQATPTEEILNEYKGLIREDIFACFLFASKALQDSSFVPIYAGSQ